LILKDQAFQGLSRSARQLSSHQLVETGMDSGSGYQTAAAEPMETNCLVSQPPSDDDSRDEGFDQMVISERGPSFLLIN
jgi:hypothetical protein